MRSLRGATRSWLVIVGLAAAGSTTGCGLVALGLGAVGLAGYGTYKAGEAGVGAARSGIESAKSGVVGAFAYGDYVVVQRASVAEVFAGTREAFGMMHMAVPTGRYDALGGELAATASDGRTVVVRMEPLSPESTRLAIRVGANGDKDASTIIHRYIDACTRPEAAGGLRNSEKT